MLSLELEDILPLNCGMFQQTDQVSALIHDALLLYGADKTGLVDYALESGGKARK